MTEPPGQPERKGEEALMPTRSSGWLAWLL